MSAKSRNPDRVLDVSLEGMYYEHMRIHSHNTGHKGHVHYLTGSRVASLKQTATLSEDDTVLLDVVRTLSDQTKARIFRVLQKTVEVSVADISDIVGVSQSAASHALADMKKLGLVSCCRCGKLKCYSLTPEGKDLRQVEKFRTLIG